MDAHDGGGDLGRAAGDAGRSSARSLRRGIAEAVGVSILLVAAGHGVRLLERDGGDSRGRGPGRHAVAVVGFRNASGRADTEWLSGALTEMLATELSSGGGLRAIPRENVMGLKADLELPEADALDRDALARTRARLGADFVVGGAYAAFGEGGAGQIRLELRLQDAAGGETLASVAEVGTRSDLGALVARAGGRVRERLGVPDPSKDAAGRTRASLPRTADAARHYAEGLRRLRLFDAAAAREQLERAVRSDPRHAPAHSALAAAWSALGDDARAQREARVALDLAEPLPLEERLVLEARYRETTREWPLAEETYRTLVRLAPDELEYGLRLAEVQTAGGAGLEAIETLDSLRRLPEPHGDDPRIDLAESRAALALGDPRRRHEAAVRAVGRARTQGSQLLLAAARRAEGDALRVKGQLEAARAALDEARVIEERRGDRAGAADAIRCAALVAWEMGELEAAGRLASRALQAHRVLGNRAGEADVRAALGRLAAARGDAAAARVQHESAAAARGALDAASALESRLDLAVLDLQEERMAAAAAAAEALLQEAATPGTQAAARAVLARTLLHAGRAEEAARVLEPIRGPSIADDAAVSAAVAIAAALTDAALGRTAAGLERLTSLWEQSRSAGLVRIALETQLVLGRLELQAGRPIAGRARLDALAHEAGVRGFAHLAGEAARR